MPNQILTNKQFREHLITTAIEILECSEEDFPVDIHVTIDHLQQGYCQSEIISTLDFINWLNKYKDKHHGNG